MRIRHLILVFALVTSLAAKDKPHEWKTGKLLDTQSERGTRLVPVNNSVISARDDRTYYVIDDGTFIWVGSRSLKTRRDKQLPITVNTEVKFAVEGDTIYLVAEDGKEHKLSFEKKSAK